jgi:hypothetical protein
MEIRLSRRKVVYTLAVGTAVLSALGATVEVLSDYHDTRGWMVVFDLDKEWNVPTIFSAFLLFAASVLLAMIASERLRVRASGASYWTNLAVIFCFLGFDELFSIHNSAKRLVPMWFKDGGLFYFRPDLRWVVIGIPATVVIVALYVPFVLRLPRRTACGIVVAGVMYIGAALGLEMVGGWWIGKHTRDNWTYSSLVVIEETLEMLGALIFLNVLLIYIECELDGCARFGSIHLHLQPRTNRRSDW